MHFCGPVIWELIIFGTRDEVNRLTAYSLEDFNLEPSISDLGMHSPVLKKRYRGAFDVNAVVGNCILLLIFFDWSTVA